MNLSEELTFLFDIQAILKVLIMFLVNWYYSITCLAVVFLVWFYVGTANPAVKPGEKFFSSLQIFLTSNLPFFAGLAAEFRFFVWLKGVIFRCFG